MGRMAHNVLRASVTADTATTDGGPATVLVDGADTPITANGLQDYTPTPGDRLLVVQVGGVVEIVQFISRGTVPSSSGGASTFRQTTAPAFPPAKDGDVWYDEANGNLPNRAESSAWVPMQVGTPAIASGSVTDDLVAQDGLNPVKGIVDMRPGAFTCLIHDWQLRDSTLNAQRFGSSGPGITLVTVAEELTHAYSDTDQTTMGAVGAAPPAEYAAGPKCTLLNVVNDTNNFAGRNVVPVQATSGLVAGDVIVSATVNVGGRIGMAPWSGIATIYLNLDPATQNTALVNGNGVDAKTRIEWLDASHNVIYTQDGLADTDAGSLGGGYFGHYDWITMNANNFDPAVIGAGVTPTYIRVSVVWEGDTISAESGSNYALELPGFNIWNVGGTAYQPGTPMLLLDHDQANTEVTLLSGLPVTPSDTYTLQVRQLPWNTTSPYNGSFPPQGGSGYGGDLTMRVHLSDGTYKDHFVGSDGHGNEGNGWTRVSTNITMPDDAVSIDILLQSWNYADPNGGGTAGATTHFVLPRLTISGWHSWAWGAGNRISDSLFEYLDANGKVTFQHDAELGTKMQGGLTIAPQEILNSNVPIDCSAGIWAGKAGVGTWTSSDSGVPVKVGMMLHPSYNGLDNAPFSMGNDGQADGSGDACMVVSADTQTSGVKAPKGFVGIAKGANPSAGATAQTTGFLFDSNANTITPLGTLGVSARIPGEVIMWPGPVIPANWLECNGQAVEGFTTYPQLHDVMHVELDVNTSFAAGTTTFTPSDTSLLAGLQVGWQIASVSIGGTNISTITAITGTTFTIATATAFGGPASFWVYPYGVQDFAAGTVHFYLPDVRNRFPFGVDGISSALGGFENALLGGTTPTNKPGDIGRMNHQHDHGGATNNGTNDGAHQHNIIGQTGSTAVTGGSGSANAAKFSSYDGHAHGGATNNGVNDGAHHHAIANGGLNGGTTQNHAIMGFKFLMYAGV